MCRSTCFHLASALSALAMICLLHFQTTTAQPPTPSQESMEGVMWPGLIVEITCTVDNPFIRVNDIELGNDGIIGYNTTLQEMGIDLKDATTVNGFIPRVPTVCVNGSLVPVNNPSVAISLVCGDIVNRISYSTVNLTHFAQIPRPENVHMNGDMLTWSPPPRISDNITTSVHIVVYPVELTYRITITDTLSSRDPEIHTTQQTFLSLSESNIYVQCRSTSRTRCHIRIELRAVIEELSLEGETETFEMLLQGSGGQQTDVPCSLLPSTESTTVGTQEKSELLSKDLIIGLITAAVVLILVSCVIGCVGGVTSVCVYNHMRQKKKKKNDNSEGQQRPPVYEEVWEPGSVEMNKNVAYGPIKASS